MPHGKRIAFDPELHRVWLICAKCGEWNLLGADATREAVPELQARFGASAAANTRGIASAPVSSRLEVLRVGTRAELVAGALALADRRRALDRIGVLPASIALGLTAVVSFITIMGWYAPTWGSGAQLAAWFGAMRIVQWVRRRRLNLATTTTGLAISVALLGIGSYFPWSATDGTGISAVGMRLAVAFVFATMAGWAVGHAVRQSLPSGLKIPVDHESIKAMELRFDATSDSVLITPFGRSELDATDSTHVLTHLTEWIGGLPVGSLDRAHALVATTDELREVIDVVRSATAERGNSIRLADLPQVYWVALDLALTRERERATRLPGVEDVNTVAAIAESLDRGE